MLIGYSIKRHPVIQSRERIIILYPADINYTRPDILIALYFVVLKIVIVPDARDMMTMIFWKNRNETIYHEYQTGCFISVSNFVAEERSSFFCGAMKMKRPKKIKKNMQHTTDASDSSVELVDTWRVMYAGRLDVNCWNDMIIWDVHGVYFLYH